MPLEIGSTIVRLTIILWPDLKVAVLLFVIYSFIFAIRFGNSMRTIMFCYKFTVYLILGAL